MTEKKNNQDQNLKSKPVLHSDEKLVCSPEFTESCIATEMDVSKAENNKK